MDPTSDGLFAEDLRSRPLYKCRIQTLVTDKKKVNAIGCYKAVTIVKEPARNSRLADDWRVVSWDFPSLRPGLLPTPFLPKQLLI